MHWGINSMKKVTKTIEETNGVFGGDGKTTDKMMEMLYNPSPRQLAGLTIIPRGLVLKFARMMMMQRALDPTRHEYKTIQVEDFDEDGVNIGVHDEEVISRYVTLDEIFIQNCFLLWRSVGGKAFQIGAMLAETQGMDEEDIDGYMTQ